MKYNKQLSDLIHSEYDKVFTFSSFVMNQLIEKPEDISSYEVLKNLELYLQGLLAKVVMDKEIKNPALFNMFKKYAKYDNFYQGIDLDLWFSNKERVLMLINKKIELVTKDIPTLIQITVALDKKSKTTEFSYQVLEAIVSLILTLFQDAQSYEEVEELVLNKYLENIYTYINNALN